MPRRGAERCTPAVFPAIFPYQQRVTYSSWPSAAAAVEMWRQVLVLLLPLKPRDTSLEPPLNNPLQISPPPPVPASSALCWGSSAPSSCATSRSCSRPPPWSWRGRPRRSALFGWICRRRSSSSAVATASAAEEEARGRGHRRLRRWLPWAAEEAEGHRQRALVLLPALLVLRSIQRVGGSKREKGERQGNPSRLQQLQLRRHPSLRSSSS